MQGHSTGKSLSAIVGRMVPDFVSEDHQNFTLFLQKYFEYLEQDLKPYDLLANTLLYADIDETLDSFIKHFKYQYSNDIPYKFSFLMSNVSNINEEIRLVIKEIRDYYLSKGNELSYEFIFRVIYGVDLTFYYPKVDILKCSDGKWYVPYYITSTVTPDYIIFYDVFIRGRTSGAKGYVSEIIPIEFPINSGLRRQSLSLTNVVGTFVDGEVIEIIGNESETLTIEASGGVSLGQGRWIGTDGFLSYDKYLQDNDYYQEYSYELRSPLSRDTYEKLIKEAVHPAGLKLFGRVVVNNVVVMSQFSSSTSLEIEWIVEQPIPQPIQIEKFSKYHYGDTHPYYLIKEDWRKVEQDIMMGGIYWGEMIIADLAFMTTDLWEANSDENCSIVAVNGIKVSGYSFMSSDITLPTPYTNGDILHVFGLGPQTKTRRLFNGDNTTTSFNLGATLNIHNLLVFVNGIKQTTNNDVYISGNNLVFTNAPASGINNIEVYEYENHAQQITMSGDGLTREFALPVKPFRNNRDCVMGFVNGLLQDVGINSNNNLVFTNAPVSGTDNIEIVFLNRLSELYDIIKLDGVSTTYRLNNKVNQFKYQVGSKITII